MKLVEITFDTTTFLVYAEGKEDAMSQLSEKDPNFVKLDPHNKWVYKWSEDSIMWSDVHIEEKEVKRGIIFSVSH